MNFKVKTPRSQPYLNWIRTQPCVSCGRTNGIHAHHSSTGGMGIKGSDYDAIPLCFNCHNDIHQGRKDAIDNLRDIINRLRAKYKGDK